MADSPRAKKNLSVSLRLVQQATQVRVAESIDLSDSALGEWIAKGHLQRACAVIAASGGKVVPEAARYLNDEQFNALLVWAKLGLEVSAQTQPGDLD
jgi:hypothetical protein